MDTHTDEQYLKCDPFFGDESDLTCRTVKLVTARKPHTCYSLDGAQDHLIQPGQRYRHERALVDRSFWGDYRICLSCMDRHLSEAFGDDEDEEESTEQPDEAAPATTTPKAPQ